ncbi:MAG TPA: 50S ribosomal protein L19e [archaeon]|nr:50S ribosomal protein L19e [archaeon]
MKEQNAKKMAAEILKVGVTKIYLTPGETKRFKDAMTKEDVRSLIKEGLIKKRLDHLQSRGRARILAAKKKKGRKRGKGKRTGKRGARMERKASWRKNVRAQRRTLKEMKDSGVKLKKPARQIYLMIKGNFFKGKKSLQAMVEEGKK